MTLYRRFGAAGALEVHRTAPAHAPALEELQRIVFPTLAPAQRFEARHYLRHIELFPEGQFCVVDPATRDGGSRASIAAGNVVGMTSTIRGGIELASPGHTFDDVIEGGWLTSHDPAGRWLYGADLGVHPAYRRRGIGRALYAARHETVHALGLEGQITVGMPSGYGAVKDTITAQQYFDELVAGTRVDPTISAQLAIGFEIRALVPDYLDDPVCDRYGIVLVLPAAREVNWP